MSKRKIPVRLTDKHFNKTVDEAIRELVQDNFEQAAQAVEEIAHWMKSAGVNAQGFGDLVGYITKSAAEATGNPVLEIKFREFLKERRIKKAGAIVVDFRR